MKFEKYRIGIEKEYILYVRNVDVDDEHLLNEMGFVKSNSEKTDDHSISVWVKPYGLGSVLHNYIRTQGNDYGNQVIALKAKRRDEFIASWKKFENDADDKVLGFIYDFVWHSACSVEEYDLIRAMFMCGYCYYFAHMLKTAFSRGQVCWCAPFGHFVWVDENNVPYDIEGVSTAEAEHYIPEEFISEGLDDFKHVPGKAFHATEEYINAAINKYKVSGRIDIF